MPAATPKHSLQILTTSLLLLLFFSASTNAGLLSFLGKAAKKADTPDNPTLIDDLSVGKLKLEGLNSGDANPVFLKIGINGEWAYTLQNGERITDLSQLEHPLLVIDKAHLPYDLRKLSVLPPDIPLLLRHNQRLFRMQRSPELAIISGNGIVPTPTRESLQGALYHLASPWYRNRVYVAGADLGSSATSRIQGIDYGQLQETLSQLRGETLVVNAGKVNLQHLTDQARRYDMQLIVIDGSRPVTAGQLEKLMASGLRDNTVDGLLKLFHKTFPEMTPQPPHYSWQTKARHQIVIRSNTAAEPLDSAGAAMMEAALHGTLLGVRIYRPDEARQLELDQRLVWWLHSDVLLYLVVSFLAGTVCFGTCREFLNWLWPRRQRSQFRWLAGYLLVRVIRLLVLGIFVLPLFGLACLIYRIVYSLYQVAHWLVNRVLRIFRFILRLGAR